MATPHESSIKIVFVLKWHWTRDQKTNFKDPFKTELSTSQQHEIKDPWKWLGVIWYEKPWPFAIIWLQSWLVVCTIINALFIISVLVNITKGTNLSPASFQLLSSKLHCQGLKLEFSFWVTKTILWASMPFWHINFRTSPYLFLTFIKGLFEINF